MKSFKNLIRFVLSLFMTICVNLPGAQGETTFLPDDLYIKPENLSNFTGKDRFNERCVHPTIQKARIDQSPIHNREKERVSIKLDPSTAEIVAQSTRGKFTSGKAYVVNSVNIMNSRVASVVHETFGACKLKETGRFVYVWDDSMSQIPINIEYLDSDSKVKVESVTCAGQTHDEIVFSCRERLRLGSRDRTIIH